MRTFNLTTLATATRQEVFDQVVRHAAQQRLKSVDLPESETPYRCMYRAPGGLACFAGCFIGDNEYYAAMEGRVWQQMVETGDAPARHASMIRGLQRIHDQHAPEHWPRLLREEAKFHHLSDFLVDKLMTPWGN